ncbi:uncharacterized protein J3R85_013625 [Psidium guajava]|nr:uncharacterized protein J3R85_013625 [Psidium guajava]
MRCDEHRSDGYHGKGRQTDQPPINDDGRILRKGGGRSKREDASRQRKLWRSQKDGSKGLPASAVLEWP